MRPAARTTLAAGVADCRLALPIELPSMCLIAIAWKAHPQFDLVLAGNRDEFLARPAAALDHDPATQSIRSFTLQVMRDPAWNASIVPVGDGLLLALRNP